MTISTMAAKGCDFNAPNAEVAKWLITHSKRKSKAMKAAIASVLKPEPIRVSKADEPQSLEAMRDYYADQLHAATQAEHVNGDEVKFWNDLMLKADESLRKSEAHSKRLGLDRGEVLPRSEVERILTNVFWSGNSACCNFAKQHALRISNQTPEKICETLRPLMIAKDIFPQLWKLAKVPGQINLPAWVVKAALTKEKKYIKPREDKPKPHAKPAINRAAKEKAPSEGEKLKTLEQMRDYYASQLYAATKAKDVDREEVKLWNDLLLKADESLRRSEAHSRKLGLLDSDELMSRSELESILSTMFECGNALCDKYLEQLAQSLSHKKPADLFHVLHPNMTALTMFEPMARMAGDHCDINLPEWVTEHAENEERLYLKRC